MNEKELRVGFVFTGSFCTYDKVFPALAACKERFGEVIPILSNFSAVTDTRFGTAAEFAEKWFRQGMQVAISGRIQTGSYTNREGRKIYTTEVVLEEQEFAESKRDGNAPVPQPADAGD